MSARPFRIAARPILIATHPDRLLLGEEHAVGDART
jgi:hypothetical protein